MKGGSGAVDNLVVESTLPRVISAMKGGISTASATFPTATCLGMDYAQST